MFAPVALTTSFAPPASLPSRSCEPVMSILSPSEIAATLHAQASSRLDVSRLFVYR